MSGDHSPTKKSILICLLYLTVITIVELIIAYFVVIKPEFPPSSDESMYWIFRITMIVLSIGKAYFIVSEFMHMKYELKRFVFYTLITVTLLFWFIIALLWEGDYFKGNRDKADAYVEVIK